MKNFRFEITKVYSGIPPQMKNFRFEMPKVYSRIPPSAPASLQAWRSYVETNLYPRGYHSFASLNCLTVSYPALAPSRQVQFFHSEGPINFVGGKKGGQENYHYNYFYIKRNRTRFRGGGFQSRICNHPYSN